MGKTEEIKELSEKAQRLLPFELLPEQERLLTELFSFVKSDKTRSVFVLNGYAGTGKTSVVGSFIKVLESIKKNVIVVAPTGRAAKVAQKLSAHPASTIHKLIYRGDSSDPSNTRYFLNRNSVSDTIFVVDEASLISDFPEIGGRSLLVNLIHYVYSCPGCKMIMVGDVAQLPPVGQSESMAMNVKRLGSLGLDPIYYTLGVPVRQSVESGIIHNATFIRYKLCYPDMNIPDALYIKNYNDVEAISGSDLSEYLFASYSEVGEDETLIITRSNKRANDFNRAIRNLVKYAEEPLERGDRIVIAKNDYYWSKINEQKGFIANGETAEVTWVGKTEKAYGRYFTDVELKFISDQRVTGAKVMLRSLVSDGPAIPQAEMETFYTRVLSSYEGELSEKIKETLEDPYYNALQVKYAYCVTCHKAQGGEWKHVYIDMGGIAPEGMNVEFYRWLYTAITRAKEKVFFINPTIPLI